MAALSRGVSSFLHPHTLRLPSSLRTTLLHARPQVARIQTPSRAFSSSTWLRYALAARSPSMSAASYMNSDPVLRTVMQTRQPVLLYKEPERRKYLFNVYGWATIAAGIGCFSFWWVQNLPPGLSFFVAPTYMVIGVAFSIIGLGLYQRPVRRISTLEVIPASLGGRIQLRVRGRKAPWNREEVIETDIWDATINEKTAPIRQEIVEADRARHQKISEGLREMSILPRIWEISARWIEQKWTSFFLRFKFAILQFGIAYVEVKGVKWKIDCNGYLRDDGLAIDRIIAEE